MIFFPPAGQWHLNDPQQPGFLSTCMDFDSTMGWQKKLPVYGHGFFFKLGKGRGFKLADPHENS